MEQAKISYSEIGDLLRRAREQLRLPMDQASRLLHIRVRYLDAMEQGRLEELPGLPYIRGYIQTYAAFLGLDKDEVMRRFDAIETAMRKENIYFPQVLSKEKTPTPRIIWVALAAAAGAYLLWFLSASGSNEKISVVDKFPSQERALAKLSPQVIQDVTCLRPQEGLYPPCILTKEPEFRVSPLNKRVRSILEMAILPLAIAPDKTKPVTNADEEDEE